MPITDCKITFSDFKFYINKYISAAWQNAWNGELHNKLHEIKPILGEWSPAYREVRRDEVVLCRIRIGHTFFTNSHLLKGEPECVACQCRLTVKHILIECADFVHIRQNYFTQASMRELFREVKSSLILDFLKEINLYKKF